MVFGQRGTDSGQRKLRAGAGPCSGLFCHVRRDRCALVFGGAGERMGQPFAVFPCMPLPVPRPTGDIFYAFLSILLEGAPFILLGALISGVIDAWLPSGAMDRLLPKRAFPAILVSGLLGIIFPVCECAIVPVIRRLVQKGLPLGCAMTYMLAAPIVNPIVALSTWTAFTGRDPLLMMGSRVTMGYVIAVLAGLIISRFAASSVLKDRVLAGISAPALAGGAAAAGGGGGGAGAAFPNATHSSLAGTGLAEKSQALSGGAWVPGNCAQFTSSLTSRLPLTDFLSGGNLLFQSGVGRQIGIGE